MNPIYQKRLLVVFTALEIVLASAFLVLAIQSSRSCFLTDEHGNCFTGNGFDSLFRVSTGSSFELILHGIILVVYGLSMMYTLYTPATLLQVGALTGMGGLVTLMAMTTASTWGSISTMVYKFACSADTQQLDGLLVHNAPVHCTTLVTPYTGVCVAGSLLFIVTGTMSIMLHVWSRGILTLRLDHAVVHSSIGGTTLSSMGEDSDVASAYQPMTGAKEYSCDL